MSVTYITGNALKAEYFQKLIGMKIQHQKVDLDEIQSLDLEEIVHHKVRQAYEHVGGPVLVEDTSLEFVALGRLPGTFIKWFQDELGYEKLCRMVDGQNRACIARSTFGYYDGKVERYWHGECRGTIPEHPYEGEAFGWDPIFIPDGYGATTRAELSEADDEATYLKIKPIVAVREFLKEVDK